jgi:methylglutaconyl-CoA hydratase
VLARPARHNALDADLMQGLLDCLDELTHGQPWPTAPTCCCCAPRGRIFARAPISSGCARWQGSVRPPRL